MVWVVLLGVLLFIWCVLYYVMIDDNTILSSFLERIFNRIRFFRKLHRKVREYREKLDHNTKEYRGFINKLDRYGEKE